MDNSPVYDGAKTIDISLEKTNKINDKTIIVISTQNNNLVTNTSFLSLSCFDCLYIFISPMLSPSSKIAPIASTNPEDV